jgi:hypothetical protein
VRGGGGAMSEKTGVFAAYDESYGNIFGGKWTPHRVVRTFDTAEERDEWVAYNPFRRGVLPNLVPEPRKSLEEVIRRGYERWRDEDPMGSTEHYIAKELRAVFGNFDNGQERST